MKRIFFFLTIATTFVHAANIPTLENRARPYLETAKAAGDAFVSVSAASGMPNLAAESLAVAFGSNLATNTETATAPYPMSLGGITLHVVDSAGADRVAQLLYVSPAQINYIVPAGTAPGLATVKIVNASGAVLSSTSQIQRVAPAVFTANADGQGVVAATAYATVAPSTVLSFPVQVYQCASGPGSCVSVPINLGVDTPVYVSLYATGLRGRSSDSALSVTVGGKPVTIHSITSFDSSSPFAGIDVVTITGLLSLRGSGEVDVTLATDGATSNAARINFQ